MTMLASLLLASALAADVAPPGAAPDEGPPAIDARPATKKGGWFSRIHYAVGWSSSIGGGNDGTSFGRYVVAEPVAFELRSFLWPEVAFHTTLNLARMIAPAITDRDGRIDYGCHLGGHVRLDDRHTLVVAPGADIAYSFTKSRYQRIVGDVRLGIDVEHGRWSTGFYVRPYGGWWRDVGEERGEPVGGALLELVNVFHVPKKGERKAR